MKNKITVYLLLMSIVASFANAEVERERVKNAFAKLDESQSNETVAKNLEIVLSGEEVSLSVLLNEVDNTTIAHSSFEGTNSVSMRQADHGTTFNKVSLGDVAFDLIQYMVEGKIPIVYKRNFLLTRENVKEWLGARKGKSLKDLQMEAVKENLKNAEEMNSRVQSEFSRGLVDFLTERLKFLKTKDGK